MFIFMFHDAGHDSQGEDAAWASPEDAPIGVDRSDSGQMRFNEPEVVVQSNGEEYQVPMYALSSYSKP